MGMSCKICNHDRRLEIDRALVSGRSKASIAREFGVSESSLANHAQHHLSRQLLKHTEIRERINSERVLDEVEDLLSRSKRILRDSEADGRKGRGMALNAIREVRATIEFLSKLAITLQSMKQEESSAEENEKEHEMKLAIERLPTCELNLLGDIQAKINGEIPWKRLLPDSFYKDEEKDYIDVSVSVDKENKDIEPERIVVRAPGEGGVIKTGSIMDNFVDVPVPQQEAVEPELDRPEPEPEPEQPSTTSTMKRRRRPLARVDFGPNMPEHKKRSAAKAYVHEHGRLPREKWLRDAL